MIILRFKKEMHTPQGKEWLDLDFKINQGDFVTFFGESGAGKTTFLKILAGLIQPQEGYIEVNGEIWFDSQQRINRPVQERKIGFVFQENSLFPNMSVRQNIEYAAGKGLTSNQLDEWIFALSLKGLENQAPSQLSGGQKQRVALIRALINQPKILLLDEPLSDLDIVSRSRLQDEIIKLYQKSKITSILVTHDLSEVFKMSTKVFVIAQGKIIKEGSPHEVFVNHEVSGKFKFTGEIIAIDQDGVVNILTVCVGNHITKVVACDEELIGLGIGSKVMVAAKAFNPLIVSLNK